MPAPAAAIDFETFYSDTCSVKDLGVWHYARHPEFRAYLVSIACEDGFEWIGPPEQAPWERIAGSLWLSHNMSFDRHVFETIGVTDVHPRQWYCTADLCAWAGLPRSLAAAVATLYDKRPDKSVRDKMKGKRPEDLDEGQTKELLAYALDDARWCLRLWRDLADGHPLSEGTPWPEWERRLSVHTAEMGWRGVPVDGEAIAKGIRRLRDQVWEARQDLPWEDPPLSPLALARECAKAGVNPPRSLAMDSEECAAWEDKYGEVFPWVGAMRRYRRCNMLAERLSNMAARIKDDGRMAYGLKYCGAITRRWSGDASVNLQNLPRREMFGVDMRSMIRAPEGRTLVLVDLAQIEPRVLALLAKDTAMLDLVRQGYGIYEAFARSAGMWDGEMGTLKAEDPAIYQAAKAMTLGCGYGSSAAKFHAIAPLLTGGSYAPSIEEAGAAVASYRRRNRKVTNLWNKLELGLSNCSGKGDYTAELPSGNLLRYRNVSSHGGLGAEIVKNGRFVRKRLWGSALTENLCQAAARDVFAHGLLKVLDHGHEVILHVHDEVVVECSEAEAGEVLADVIGCMSEAPEWASGLPVGAEGKISKTYAK